MDMVQCAFNFDEEPVAGPGWPVSPATLAARAESVADRRSRYRREAMVIGLDLWQSVFTDEADPATDLLARSTGAERVSPTGTEPVAVLEPVAELVPVRSTYRERREAKAARLEGWAEKREAKATAAAAASCALSDLIPFGQPILIGHHSEGRARRDQARIAGGMDKAIEHAAKAESMRSRAAGIESQLAGSIYSDDPDAVQALTARVLGLEAERDRIKAYNASCRKGSPDPSILDEKQRGLSSVLRHQGRAGEGGAFPSYHLTNLSGNIKRNRDRLAALQRLAA